MTMAHFVASFNLKVSSRQVVSLSWRTQPRGSQVFRRVDTRLFSVGKRRVVFLGTPDVAAASLQTLYEETQKDGTGYELVSVITQPPRRRKRKGKLEPSPVGKVADDLGLPVLHPEKVRIWLLAENITVVVADIMF